MNKKHYPVLSKELINSLDIKENGIYVDCTLGLGGHTSLIASIAKKGKVIAIDQDINALEHSKKELKKFKNVIFVHSNFSNLEKILKENNILKVDGIVFDLGTSYYQLNDQERGFSYKGESKLDMRMDQSSKLDARVVLNTYSLHELEKILKEYGEEKQYKKLANEIVKYRENNKIIYNTQLNKIVGLVKGFVKEKNPLKQIYQAIRIEVNKEFDNLKIALKQALNSLKVNSKLAVITFHSLEDKIVKDFFWNMKQIYFETPKEKTFQFKTHKTIYPSKQEIEINNPSRSAKLRVITKNYE